MGRAHSPTLPLLHLSHSSFSNLSFASHTSQALNLRHLASRPWCKKRMRHERPSKWHLWVELILQPFRHFTCVTSHSPTLPLLHLRHSSFSNLSFPSHMSQALHIRHLASRPWCKKRMRYERPSKWHLWAELNLQPFRHFTYVTAHSQTFRRFTYVTTFSNPYVASPTSQLILKPFFRFSYVTGSSLTSPDEPPMM